MERHQDRVVILLARHADRDALRQRAPRRLEPGRRAVAAENPDDALLPVALAEELAVLLRVRGREEALVVAAAVDPSTPRGQQRDVQPAGVRLVDDVVDVLPVTARTH